MTWNLVAQLSCLMLVGGVIINTVAADLIEKWKK